MLPFIIPETQPEKKKKNQTTLKTYSKENSSWPQDRNRRLFSDFDKNCKAKKKKKSLIYAF